MSEVNTLDRSDSGDWSQVDIYLITMDLQAQTAAPTVVIGEKTSINVMICAPA